MKCLESLIVAFSMYSKIPMPQITWTKENMKNTLCYFPLIGAVIGALLWLWYWLCGIAGFGVMLQAAVAVLIPVLVTGGIHLDGFRSAASAKVAAKPLFFAQGNLHTPKPLKVRLKIKPMPRIPISSDFASVQMPKAARK